MLEKTFESPLDCKEIQPVHPKANKSWIFIERTDAWSWNSNTLGIWCEELTHLKRPWCWERLKAEGEGHDRGWDGWMASLTRWTWVWVGFRSCDGQGGLACCHPLSCKESHMTERLNWTEKWIKACEIASDKVKVLPVSGKTKFLLFMGREIKMILNSSVISCGLKDSVTYETVSSNQKGAKRRQKQNGSIKFHCSELLNQSCLSCCHGNRS